MGLFNFFKKKPKKKKEEPPKIITAPAKLEDRASRESFVSECCKNIQETEQQNQEARSEYQLVTSYLVDIQKIDEMTAEERSPIEEAAEKIISLNQEKDQYRKQEPKITEAQKMFLRQHEDVVPEEIVKLKKEEEYQQLVQSDMRHLEGEKASLAMEKEEILSKNRFLRNLSVVLCVLVLVLICALLLLSNQTKANLQVPFLLTVIMGLCGALYIMVATRKNLYKLKVTELKTNKAIMLLNKVKIKYVNCTSTIEYIYEKYHVDSAMQFTFMWEEYVRIREEEAKLRKNADMLDFYQKTILTELRKKGLEDPKIWVYQPMALLDSKEMVEVRHRLNVRRQKLRERIDFNYTQGEANKEVLRKFVKEHPEYAQETQYILDRFRVTLENL